MKGKTSKRLESVLGDPAGRRRLRSILISGREGRITAGKNEYLVSTDIRRHARTGRESGGFVETAPFRAP